MSVTFVEVNGDSIEGKIITMPIHNMVKHDFEENIDSRESSNKFRESKPFPTVIEMTEEEPISGSRFQASPQIFRVGRPITPLESAKTNPEEIKSSSDDRPIKLKEVAVSIDEESKTEEKSGSSSREDLQ